MFTLAKKFRFEMAHRLAQGYEGKCANIHGHSWNGEIIVNCPELGDYGMALDFGVLAEFRDDMEDLMDHKIILYSKDKILIDFIKDQGMAVCVVDHNPTSEVIAKNIHGHFYRFLHAKHPQLVDHIDSVEVIIEETCTSRCHYKGEFGS